MSQMVKDIIRRSISAKSVDDYIYLVQQISDHPKRDLLVEPMTDRRLSGTGGESGKDDPRADPLYRLLVKEAQDNILKEQ